MAVVSGFFHDIWIERQRDRTGQKTMVLPEDTEQDLAGVSRCGTKGVGERAYDREYRCEFDSSDANAFSWDQHRRRVRHARDRRRR